MTRLGVLILLTLMSGNLLTYGGDAAKEEMQTEIVEEEKDEQEEDLLSEETEEEPVLLDTADVKITYAKWSVINWGTENEFSFYFDVENRTGNDLTITTNGLVIDGQSIDYGYFSFPAAASTTTNGCIGYADHDYQGDSTYDAWLIQESENGVRELTVSLVVKDASGNQIEQSPEVIIDLGTGTIKNE